MDDIYFAMVVWPRTIWICSCTLENLHSFLLGFLFIFRGVFDAGLNETDANFCFDWLAKEHSYFYILEGFSFVLSFFLEKRSFSCRELSHRSLLKDRFTVWFRIIFVSCRYLGPFLLKGCFPNFRGCFGRHLTVSIRIDSIFRFNQLDNLSYLNFQVLKFYLVIVLVNLKVVKKTLWY